MEQILYKKSKVDELLNSDTLFYEETTYSALKQKRDNSQLTKGKMYRITDYQCTTTQFDTQSANHQFDILVVATEKNILNENAKAIKHEGDTYFADSHLGAWELKYCLDNDLNRFAWADSENGKGVIFYMKDEFNNECPYDFKNIQFKRYKLISVKGIPFSELFCSDGEFEAIHQFFCETTNRPQSQVDETAFAFFYTFSYYNSDGTISDRSLKIYFHDYSDCNGASYWMYQIAYNNIIKPFFSNISIDEDKVVASRSLNNIVFTNYDEDTNYGVKNNIFGCDTRDCTLGKKCANNTFGNSCYYNTFGNSCYYNTFGNDCDSNTFGNSCYYNTFGNDCDYNTFGNSCDSNTFGNDCDYNTFGNSCDYNTLLDNATHTETDSYAKWNIFENGVSYVELKASASGNSNNYLQNIKISQGVAGTFSSHKVITETRNLAYQVVYKASGSLEKEI